MSLNPNLTIRQIQLVPVGFAFVIFVSMRR